MGEREVLFVLVVAIVSLIGKAGFFPPCFRDYCSVAGRLMDVIASEAKQSLYSSKTRDCHSPSGLAMTTTQIICDRALFVRWLCIRSPLSLAAKPAPAGKIIAGVEQISVEQNL